MGVGDRGQVDLGERVGGLGLMSEENLFTYRAFQGLPVHDMAVGRCYDLALLQVESGGAELSLFEGAYASEIFRAGIVSIHRGQWEAAYSLGLSSFDTYYCVILPQAIRRILPPLTSQAISLIKDSSLVSVIAIYEMTMQANALVAETFLTFEIYFTIAGIYLVITVFLSQVVALLERKFKVHH